jgi:P4 family phage/plasmid primase-like protien
MNEHDNANLDGRFNKATSWYASQGWKILPCYGIVGGRCTCNQTHAEPKDVGKHPALNSWHTGASDDPIEISRWWERDPEANIGVFCRPSGFFVIDIDPRSGGHDSFGEFEKLVEGALPPTVEATTGVYTLGGRTLRGRHIFYRCDPSEELIGNLKAAGIKGIDIKHNGYVLIAPSRHFSGVNYEWVEGKAPWETEMAEAPEELLAFLRKRKSRSAVGTVDWSETFADVDFGSDRVDIEKMLQEGIEEGSRAVDIYKLTCAIANKFDVKTPWGRQSVETLMLRFNYEKVTPPLEVDELTKHVNNAIDFVVNNPKIEMKWPGITDKETGWAKKLNEETREKFSKSTEQAPELVALTGVVQPVDDKYLPGTLAGSVSESVNNGESIAEASSLSNLNVPKDTDAINEEDGGKIGERTLSDTGNGRRFVDTFGVAIRYTEGIGWFHWSGSYWKPDVEGLEMQELAKSLAPVIASEVVQYEGQTEKQSEIIKWAQLSKSNARLKSAIENANSDRRVRVGVDEWDSDLNLLGVLNGVVDLRTGELLQNRPDLYITKRAPVAYTPGLRNVRWQQFLEFATGGDKEYQDWLQRAAGYSLTGLSKYDLMFLVYGPAGSGKNTFVEAIVKCLGTKQYSWPFDSSILASGDGNSQGSDLYHWAELRGRRMVWVDELPDSERLKENSVKKLTGSSEISARSPGEKPFTFSSQAKLWISTNHRPIINDDAMWRRIRPMPFTHVPENPDPDLKEYIFDAEGALPAVLSWCVEGAIKMLNSSARDALGWCSVVSEAAEIYRKNEDRIGLFLDEETNVAEGTTTPIKSLYSIYRIWAEDRGEKPMSQTAFQKKMLERNVNLIGTGSSAVVHGRSLKPRPVLSGEVDWGAANRFAR